MRPHPLHRVVIPAKAGIQAARSAVLSPKKNWMPAFAGMTAKRI
jgi:hypothetical protein